MTEFDDDLAALIDDMFASMAVANGVGLAANQIGVDLRVFVYDCPDSWDVRHVGHVVNPVLELSSPQEHTQHPRREDPLLQHHDIRWEDAEEGCLSVPGPSATVSRAVHAAVTGVDRFGRPLRIDGHGLFARCLQHECDHLDGRLYVDHLSAADRRATLRAMDEMKADVWAQWDDNAGDLGKEPDVGQSRG